MKRLLGHVQKNLAALTTARNQKQIINEFCESSGLVYFGSVSQRDDDHHIVRGLTVSNAHHDRHYCIGTHDGYDVVFVQRSDTILTNHSHTWHIMEFDLKNAKDLPHIFVGSPTHGMGFHSLLKTKYPHLHATQLGSMGLHHSKEFTDYFKIFSRPDLWLSAENLFTPDITEAIGRHFRGLVLEIAGDNLYVYSEKTTASKALLDTMLTNGVWLAKVIDAKSQPLG